MPSINRHIILFASLILLALTSCHQHDEFADNPYGNFDALWTAVDHHYCFFEDKNIDWNDVRNKYRQKITPEITDKELFDICASMLDELQDGHVNLSSYFNTSAYRKWWTAYPQDFNLRTIEEFYLKFDYQVTSGIIYKVLPGEIGYLYYPSFSNIIGETNLDYILASFAKCKAIIIDVRDNGGGNMTNIDKFVARFISEDTHGGYIRHKTGPGHNQFSDPYPIIYHPAPDYRMHWKKPIAVLCNRSTFSAANDFVSVMKSLPQVTVIGAKTGGGAGLPFSYELPNGWSVRLSAAPVSNPEDECIETGIEPSEGFALHAWSDELANGKDAILDKAVEFLSKFKQ